MRYTRCSVDAVPVTKSREPWGGSLLRENCQTEEKAEARLTFQNGDTRRPIVIPVLVNPCGPTVEMAEPYRPSRPMSRDYNKDRRDRLGPAGLVVLLAPQFT